jgi:TolB-like protein
VRRTFGVLLLCLSFGLIAAAPPSPAPRPLPSPKATFLPTAPPTPTGVAPTVVIFPFETPSDVDAKTGGAIAQIYSQVLTQTGGLKVLPVPQKIKREDFEKYAHSKAADYYISGYVQPIGTGAAIVASIVDVNAGIAVYSQTTQVESVNDVASQALTAHTVIMQVAGVDRPQQVVSGTNATPAPSSTSGAQYNVTNVLGGLFKRGGKNTASATPTPAVKPAVSMLIARLTGDAAAGDISQSTDDLFRAMNKYYNASIINVNSSNLTKTADSICGTNRRQTIASGVLNAVRYGGIRSHNSYTFTLKVYTCFGSILFTNTQTNDDKRKAVANAVDEFHRNHPENTP